MGAGDGDGDSVDSACTPGGANVDAVEVTDYEQDEYQARRDRIASGKRSVPQTRGEKKGGPKKVNIASAVVAKQKLFMKECRAFIAVPEQAAAEIYILDEVRKHHRTVLQTSYIAFTHQHNKFLRECRRQQAAEKTIEDMLDQAVGELINIVKETVAARHA